MSAQDRKAGARRVREAVEMTVALPATSPAPSQVTEGELEAFWDWTTDERFADIGGQAVIEGIAELTSQVARETKGRMLKRA